VSVDPGGNRLVQSSSWIERMIWRTVFLILFLVGLVLFVYSDGNLLYLVFVFGGLFPGLFLMAREQGERHIEAQRAALMPEGRHDVLPEVSGGLSGPLRPELSAPVARGYRDDYPAAHEPVVPVVPYGGRPYDDEPDSWPERPEPVVRSPRDLDPDNDDGRGGHPVAPH
jgi:hypothetical protein